MTNLVWLDISDNQISDISALKNLINLRNLDIDDNQVSDISALKDMTRLTVLDIDDNDISDMSPLKNLTNLTVLDLHNNQISDVSPLRDMIHLTDLDLDDNDITDVSPLKDMIYLTVLDLDGNKISDISPLNDMIHLTDLDLHDNNIVDISPLKNMIGLTYLDLSNNRISDFSPIAGLISNLEEYYNSNQTIPIYKPEDVNRDGVVNITDIVLAATNFDDPNLAALAQINLYPDVNNDGIVDIRDLVLIAAEIGSAAAPTLSKHSVKTSNLTPEDLTQWIRLAKQLDVQAPHLLNGIAILEQLLVVLTSIEELPSATALLANYPNPFNPETWIPYQLAKPAEVSISIHSADGKLIKTLKLGQLPAGTYHKKSRSAYWDGRNELGEPVASGIYFYTLSADSFTATRKMVIWK